MALLVVLAMEKSEGVRASGLCYCSYLASLLLGGEEIREGKRGCCCLLCVREYARTEREREERAGSK